jgi:hypothetical protein
VSHRFALATAGWALTAACATSPAVSTAKLDFVATPAGAANAPAGATTPPTVRASQGRVEILGQLMTSDPCYDLSATFTNVNRELRVQVNATKRQGICAMVIETFAYRAVIEPIPAGDYSLEVVHALPGSSTPTSSLIKQSVTVK